MSGTIPVITIITQHLIASKPNSRKTGVKFVRRYQATFYSILSTQSFDIWNCITGDQVLEKYLMGAGKGGEVNTE